MADDNSSPWRDIDAGPQWAAPRREKKQSGFDMGVGFGFGLFGAFVAIILLFLLLAMIPNCAGPPN